MPGFFRLLAAVTLLGVAKVIEKTDEVIEDFKKNPPETTDDIVERYRRELHHLQEKEGPEYHGARRLENALNQLDKVQNYLSPFRRNEELRKIRQTIDVCRQNPGVQGEQS